MPGSTVGAPHNHHARVRYLPSQCGHPSAKSHRRPGQQRWAEADEQHFYVRGDVEAVCW